MASPTDICNLALGHIGGEANVQSISPPEATVEAENSAKFYPIARDMLLEMHNWFFAMKRAVLASVTNPTTSWNFAYTLPSDCLKAVSVLPPGTTDDTATEDFVTEAAADGSLILYTNVDQATLRYLVRITDTSKFTPLFVVALSWLLGTFLAGPIIKGRPGIAASDRCTKGFSVAYAMATTSSANTAQLDNTMKDQQPIWISDR